MTAESYKFDRRFLRRVFPGVRLLGAIRMAFDLRKLIIAAFGLTLLQVGLRTLDQLFPGSVAIRPDVSSVGLPIDLDFRAATWTMGAFHQAHVQLTEPFHDLFDPLLALLDPRSDWVARFHAIMAIAWLFAVWSMCGAAICRIAVVRVARMEQVGIAAAMAFSLRNTRALLIAPLLPFAGIVFCGALLAAYGLLYWIPFAGTVLGGVLFIIPLSMGVVMTVLALGLVAGWPLLQAAVAAGAEDALDAVSRSFGYVNQRIGSLMGLAAFAWIEGMIGIVLMNLLAAGVLRTTDWGLGLSAPSAEIATIFGRSVDLQSGLTVAAHSFWLGLISTVAHAWAYSFFWTAAALIYLWLRYEVDSTPWEEIDPPSIPPRGLITETLTLPAGHVDPNLGETQRA